jgi:hypothetical protein
MKRVAVMLVGVAVSFPAAGQVTVSSSRFIAAASAGPGDYLNSATSPYDVRYDVTVPGALWMTEPVTVQKVTDLSPPAGIVNRAYASGLAQMSSSLFRLTGTVEGLDMRGANYDAYGVGVLGVGAAVVVDQPTRATMTSVFNVTLMSGFPEGNVFGVPEVTYEIFNRTTGQFRGRFFMDDIRPITLTPEFRYEFALANRAGHYSNGSGYRKSVFTTEVRFEVIPSPGSAALLGLTAIGVFARRRR